jgi:outer membrane protein OmpA-like peptidoglycan-associated protein
MKFVLLIFSFLLLSPVFSQEIVPSENIGDCFGSISLNQNASFQAGFTGKAGFNNDVRAYENSFDLKSFNSLWMKVHTQVPGVLSLSFIDLPKQTEIVIFEVDSKRKCEDIHQGTANVKFHTKLGEDQNETKTSINSSAKKIYYLYINTLQEGDVSFKILSSFKVVKSKEQIRSLQSVKDLRTDELAPGFSVLVIDKETKLPVESSVIVKNTKGFNALYDANVLIFPESEYLSFDLEINAMGYFFKDITFNRRDAKSDSLNIELRPVKTNDQIELEGIQFESQSDVLLESAKSKIRRLRDFMALNKSVEIEVVGHVYKEGRNTWKAKRLSKKRAKRVKQYLEQSGISPKRIFITGKGNAKMIYPEPENDLQTQANRRVEIKIK